MLKEDVQKHWQWCEMKQIMNAEVTSLHLAQRAMVPTVIVPHYTFQQIQDGNTGNTGWKYRKYTNHRMEIQQRHQNTPNTRLAKALKRHHSIWCRAHWCRWSGHAVASHCAALRILSKAANIRWKYSKYTMKIQQITANAPNTGCKYCKYTMEIQQIHQTQDANTANTICIPNQIFLVVQKGQVVEALLVPAWILCSGYDYVLEPSYWFEYRQWSNWVSS